MATTYAYLVDPNKQYMTKSGTINVNGTLRVYDAATDDIVITYKDFNGTENESSIKLDNNGRAIVIADSSRAYRLEVYDRYGSLQWTVSPLWCLAAGGGVNVHTTRVISTDGSIDVDQIDVGSTTTFDIGLAPNDSDEFLEWITCSEEDCGSTWYPVYQSGTMETEAGQGIKVHGGHLYHFTNSFTVDPNGTGINYDTFRVTMYCGDEIVDVRDFDIDSSLNDAVLCEFSRDVVPTEDTHVYFKLTIPSTCEVTAEVQCHRIYSGINAVPDSCANKPWVSEYFEEKSSMSAYIPFSGLDYNQGGAITGISGSAIYAALDSGTVSAIASSYAESAISSISGWSGDFSSISSKIDWSSSGVFQPSGDYQTAGDYAYNSAVSSKVDQSAFDQCCDEVHSALDEKLDKSASSEFQPSGDYVYESSYSSFSSEVTNNISSLSSTVSGVSADMSAYVPFFGLEYNDNGDISGISGSAIAAGLDSAAVSSIASSYAESAISSISGWSGDFSSISSKIDWSSSGVFQPSGDYAYNSSLSSKADQSALEQCCDEVHSALDEKLDKSASGEFQPSGNYVYESAYSSFSSEVTNNITSISSTVSGLTGQYIEQSASSMFQPSGNYASASDLSAYVPFSGIEGEGGRVTGISGSAIKGHEYTGISPVTVDNTADTISVDHRTLCVDSTMTAYNSGSSVVIGVNVAGLDLSSKLDASASSLFYPMDNPSGYITGVDLTPYQMTADMSAYAHESSLSAKLDASASSEFYSTSNPSGFLTAHQSLAGYATEAYVDSSVSSKLDTTAFSTVSGDFLTSHQSLAGYATESYVDSAVSGKLDVTASSQFLTSLPDDLAYTSDVASAVSGKMDKSESSSFYPMDSNPSGYLTAHQSLAGYATETYVDSAVSGKLDATAYDSAEFYSTSNPSGFIDEASASAIASSYQVVSATATQLNAGTSYLTSVNETPISASRAGNAANAALATSAWYDGTGRLISALPDEATVSSIASAYAESAASSKQDASAMTAYQEVSGMTAYQPVGVYIYESALGWAEVN